jgi:Histidine kinase-, DNA gyrase B-, and HSP90-like ATPase
VVFRSGRGSRSALTLRGAQGKAISGKSPCPSRKKEATQARYSVTAGRAAPILERATFRTSRLLDFASEKELIAQTGHRREVWPLVVLKELTDNAIDACEEVGIAPEIVITVDKAGITVADNGPGIPAETVKHILDFTVRVSSREAYVSPTRGAQGNALKTIIAMPFVVDGERGKIEIEARGVRHRIIMSVDRVRQEPVIHHEQSDSERRSVGTVVRVPWRNLAQADFDDEVDFVDEDEDILDEGQNSPRSIQDARSRFLQIAADYAWLNPHTAITVDWFGERTAVAATDPAWSKWKPSEPTSPHWYTTAHLERLIGAYIKHDADNGRKRTVREFISEFRGLSATAKQAAVLNATGLARAPLSALLKGGGFDRGKIGRLLAAMTANSAPVKPVMLGTIGKEHFRKRFAAAGCEMESFEYRRVMQTEDNVPWIIETAFAWCPEASGRRLITGVNWSPGIVNPFRELGEFGTSLDTILTRARADTDDPVILVLHIACPRVEYTDRGKSALVLS